MPTYNDNEFGGPHYDPDLFQIGGKLSRLCKGGGTPPPPKKLSRSEIRREERRQDKRALKQAQKIAALNPPPEPPEPPAPPAPVPTLRNRDAARIEANQRASDAKRGGRQSTIAAGETGGYNPLSTQTPNKKKTLLGE